MIILIIVALPLSLIGGILNAITRPGRTKRLTRAINELWLPNHKYIYLHYNSQSIVAGFIEAALGIIDHDKNVMVYTPAYTDAADIDLKKTRTSFTKEVEQCLASWGVGTKQKEPESSSK